MRKIVVATIGFGAAPLASAMTLTAYTILIDQARAVGDWISLIVIYYAASAVVTVLVGLPVFLVLLRFGGVRGWTALFGGALIGALVAFGIGLATVGLTGVLAMAASGAAAGMTLWSVWRSADKRTSTAS